MGVVLLDSSVLIALLNPRDKHHGAALASYSKAHTYQLSALSITEVMPSAIEAGVAEEISAALSEVASKVIPLDSAIAHRAAEIRVRSGLKTPDSIISASAALTGAALWTFDKKLAAAHKGARLLA